MQETIAVVSSQMQQLHQVEEAAFPGIPSHLPALAFFLSPVPWCHLNGRMIEGVESWHNVPIRTEPA